MAGRLNERGTGVLSLIAGAAVLAGTWFFYRGRLEPFATAPLAWVQPTLLVAGGVLALLAGGSLLAQRAAGRGLLTVAIGVIPAILAARLAIVIAHAIAGLARAVADDPGRLVPAAIVERIALNPRNLAINLALIAAIVAISAWRKGRRASSPEREHDRPQPGAR